MDMSGTEAGQAGERQLQTEQAIDLRVEQAQEDSAFKSSPELREGLHGFYELHYTMDGVIKDVLDNDVSTEEAGRAQQAQKLEGILAGSLFSTNEIHDKIISLTDMGNTPPSYGQAALPVLAGIRLARMRQPEDRRLQRAELMAVSRANEALFAESSVAITTLTEEDKQRVIENHLAIQNKIKRSGLFTDAGEAIDLKEQDISRSASQDYIKTNPLANIERAEKTFWDDVRFADQLLFHNTANFNQVYAANTLLPRRTQLARFGKFNTPNLEYYGDRYHSPTPHWSEDFDEWNYRGDGPNAGTIAIPLAEIVKTAPYARDSQYGELDLKEDALEKTIPRVVIHDGMIDIGSGSADTQGSFGSDRTFYSSPKDVASDAPIEEAPDGYGLTLNEKTTWVQLGDTEGGADYGIGQHLPAQFKIDVGDRYLRKTNNIEAVRTHDEQRKAGIEAAIKDLQHASITRYGARLVVPIRSGVMDFFVHDDGKINGKHEAHFSEVQSAAA